MKVSVIIPYTTGLAMLEDCFESLKEQSYKDFEVVFIQDQIPEIVSLAGNITEIESPKELIEQFRSDFPITYIENETNLGVGASRNKGIQNAKGDYIYFLDMDDFLMPDTLENLVNAVNEEEGCLLAYGKKKTSWYKRKVYMKNLEDQLAAAQEEQEDADDFQDSQTKESSDEGDDIVNDVDTSVLDLSKEIFTKQMIKKRKGISNISVLNMLIQRKIIVDNQVFFEESIRVNADLVYMAKLASKIQSMKYVPEAIYVKRKRNNPVQYPALTQIKYEGKFNDYIEAYRTAIRFLGEEPVIRNIIDQKLINYYCNYFATKLRRSEMPHWREERFKLMGELVSAMDPELLRKQKHYKKRMIKALRKQNLKRSLFYVNCHLGRKKAKKLLHNKKVISTYLYFHYFTKMGIKENYVMCESFMGRNYADSPKNMYEYLSEKYPGKYKFIWSVTKNSDIPYPHTKVKRFGIRYAYYLARSKYFVFNIRQPQWMRKREGQVFVMTWHGTPLKKLVFDQEEVCSASPLYKQQMFNQSRIWDYMISDNKFSTDAFRSAFLFDKEIIETGYPRNDLLYHPNKEEIALKIKKKLKIDPSKKIILYAPTWRDDQFYDKGKYKFSLHMDFDRYHKELGEDYVMLLRTHYHIADQLDLSCYGKFVVNVSKYDDIAELYLISDILITDYSSVFFDYANLRRPILFYTYDLENYRDILRGFYMDIEKDVPGPLLFDDEQVIQAIKHVDEIEKQYKDRYNAFYNRFCYLDDGNATKRIVEHIFDL